MHHARISTATPASHVLIFESCMQQKRLMVARLLPQEFKEAGTKATQNSKRTHEPAVACMGLTGAKPRATRSAGRSHGAVHSWNEEWQSYSMQQPNAAKSLSPTRAQPWAMQLT